jgi:hypothetical protein
MRNRLWKDLICVALVFAGGGITARAQIYSIDWYKISGGGGTSASGAYSISGTIGQHDAGGPLTGGNYSLVGGFWSPLAVVQTAGAPLLKLFLTATNTAVISWPFPSTGWSLQQNGSLGTANWVTPPQTVSNDGINNFVVVSPAVGSQFYRLSKP